MIDTDLAYPHRYIAAEQAGLPPLLLLHGTGGDENDLLPLGAQLLPGAAMIAPRGDVSEHGMPRFFRRLAEGVFDEADVIRAADKLAAFVTGAREAHGLGAPIAVGYSNGANVAAAMLLLQPQVLAGAVLLRAMRPLSQPPTAGIDETPVLIVSGALDPIVPAANADALEADLARAGARVEKVVVPASHGLTADDLARAGAWLAKVAAA